MILTQHRYICQMKITDREILAVIRKTGPRHFVEAVGKELHPIVHRAGAHELQWTLSLVGNTKSSGRIDLHLKVIETQKLSAAIWWFPLNLLRGNVAGRFEFRGRQAMRTALMFAVGKVCMAAQHPALGSDMNGRHEPTVSDG